MNDKLDRTKPVTPEKKPPFGKDRDIADHSLKVRIFFVIGFPCTILGFVLYRTFKVPWYYSLLAAIVTTMIVLWLLKIIDVAMDHMSGRRSTTTIRDQLSGDISRIKYLIRNKQYDAAYNIVESVLSKDPDYPLALYFKGEILWEGFHLRAEAKETMLKVMQLLPPADPLYISAMEFRNKI